MLKCACNVNTDRHPCINNVCETDGLCVAEITLLQTHPCGQLCPSIKQPYGASFTWLCKSKQEQTNFHCGFGVNACCNNADMCNTKPEIYRQWHFKRDCGDFKNASWIYPDAARQYSHDNDYKKSRYSSSLDDCDVDIIGYDINSPKSDIEYNAWLITLCVLLSLLSLLCTIMCFSRKQLVRTIQKCLVTQFQHRSPRPVIQRKLSIEAITQETEVTMSSNLIDTRNDHISTLTGDLKPSLRPIQPEKLCQTANNTSARNQANLNVIENIRKDTHPVPPNAITPHDLFMYHDPSMGDMESECSGLLMSSSKGPVTCVQRRATQDIRRRELVGQGRFGRVYYAEDNYNRKLAVKVFLTVDENQYKNEVAIFENGLLNHPNIINFMFADCIDAGLCTELWIITQFYQHGSLFDYLNRERPTNTPILTHDQTWSFSVAIASGLAYIHGEEIISDQMRPKIAHRDLKSKNILIKDDQQSCVIADFGMAVTIHPITGELDGIIGLSKTAGTIRYLAPEFLQESVDLGKFTTFKRADMYTFALVLWEILTCTYGCFQLPYEKYISRDPSIEDMIGIFVNDNTRISTTVRPSINPLWLKNFEVLVDIITESWLSNPISRPSATNVMKRALAGVKDRQGNSM